MQSWDIHAGKPTSIEQLMEVIRENDFNVTFSGGDPLYQADGVAELARTIKSELGKNVWCYTGYLWEDIVNDSHFAELLKNIDVLVDGQFILAKRDISLIFKGSDNQRIIRVPESLASGKIVLWE